MRNNCDPLTDHNEARTRTDRVDGHWANAQSILSWGFFFGPRSLASSKYKSLNQFSPVGWNQRLLPLQSCLSVFRLINPF